MKALGVSFGPERDQKDLEQTESFMLESITALRQRLRMRGTKHKRKGLSL
jgi:hypothetical protein